MNRFEFNTREMSGALGDLGTLLPLALGAVALGGLSAGPVFLGFAAFYLVSAVVYRVPVPVQPMKAIAAVLLIGAASPASVALSGVLIGAILTGLALSGLLPRLGRLMPQSVLAGLQLGLGLALAGVALELMAASPVAGGLGLGLLSLLILSGRPAALWFLAAALAAGLAFDLPGLPVTSAAGFALPPWPAAGDIGVAVNRLLLPQLPLTLANAVFVTALVAGDCHGPRAARVTPERLCLTTGLANLVLAPLGALPMCHGAGGVAAHHRFGARTGGAPLMLAAGLAALALVPGALGLLAALPAAALGALLLVAAAGLAATPRILDCRPSCRPVIAVAAAATLFGDPLYGLLAGTAAELVRKAVVRRRFGGAAHHRPD